MEYYTLYRDMLNQPHLLIAGATGSGKSVLVNALINTAIVTAPTTEYIFLDPKRVELSQYRKLYGCRKYASEPHEMVPALQAAMAETEKRYKKMQKQGLRKYQGAALYVVIDELADLMTTQKKQVVPILQRLCQIGRAANIHVIAATQCPLAEIIPTKIKVNFDARIALRTASKQDSRNIIGIPDAHFLPKYGECYYSSPAGMKHYRINPYGPFPEIIKANSRRWF